MARITVEDCIGVINNQYDLVILAKERAVQLGRGAAPAVDVDNDKKPVIALREIAEEKITEEDLGNSIVDKLRLIPDYVEEETDTDETSNDTFRQMYQGGLSKSEMEKPASRKFTARIPKPELKPEIIEESVTKTEEDVTLFNETVADDIPLAETTTLDEVIVDSTQEDVAFEEVLIEETAADETASPEIVEETIIEEELSPEVESVEEDLSSNEEKEEI